MDRATRIHGVMRNVYTTSVVESQNERAHSEDLDVDGII
jgi:hypothetical protein